MGFIVSLLGILSNLFAFSLQLSPMPAVIKGIKEGDLKSIPITYFIAGIINSILWFSYGMGLKNGFVIGINFIGMTLFTGYMNCTIYIQKIPQYHLYLNGGLGALLLFCLFAIPYQLNSYIAVVIGIIWQSTTLQTTRIALKKKNPAYVNILLAYISFTNFTLWTLYGIFTRIYSLSLVNAVCAVLTFVNIYIYYWSILAIPDDDCFIILLKQILKPENAHELVNESDRDMINNQSDFNTPIGHLNK